MIFEKSGFIYYVRVMSFFMMVDEVNLVKDVYMEFVLGFEERLNGDVVVYVFDLNGIELMIFGL